MPAKKKQPARKSRPFRDGELDVILSMVPTKDNIARLAMLLERSEDAIVVIYRKAYAHGDFTKSSKVMQKKILAAKKRLGIVLGRQTLPKESR